MRTEGILMLSRWMICSVSRRMARRRKKVSGPHPTLSSRPMNRFSAASRLSASARSWYTVSIPAARASSGDRNRRASSCSTTLPASGCSAPDMTLSRVLFPAPLSPTMAVSVPLGNSSDTSRSATTPP